MRPIKRFLFLVILLFSFVGSSNAQDSDNLFNRINDLRASLGLAPYSLNGSLSTAANNHARWMVESGQVSHTQTDGSNPRSRAAAAGYNSQWVSENIYGGTGATADVAWNFWVNSSIHYRGLTNPNYKDIGIGTAQGEWGRAYVLVFGASEWQAPQVVSAVAGSNSGEAVEAANALPPSFVVGVDSTGNIMHEIQPGDTLGDIALLYGYTWDDVPYMMQLNELDDVSVRELKVGAVFLIPPSDGTFTPTPAPATSIPSPTSTAEPTETVSLEPTAQPTQTPHSLPATAETIFTPTLEPSIAPVVSPTSTPLIVAQSLDGADVELMTETQRVTANNGRSMWLYIAIGVQVILIVGAGVELAMRQLRR